MHVTFFDFIKNVWKVQVAMQKFSSGRGGKGSIILVFPTQIILYMRIYTRFIRVRGGKWLSRDIISAKMIKLGNEGRQINAGYIYHYFNLKWHVLWFITPKWEKYKFRFVIPVGILYGHTGHTGWYTGQPVVHSSTFG